MIHLFIQELKRSKVDYVVSPYESDAQLAFLYKANIVDFVITEDSDLLPYGVEKVLFKMDPQGNGVEIDMTRIDKCPEYILPGGQLKFTQDMLL
jgi:exonuclease 1